MYKFAKDLYTDVRIEDVFETKIGVTLGKLDEMKERRYKAAFIRIFDGENFIGRLPQINISSHLYDMFGKDYIGVGKDSISKLSKSNCISMNVKVTRL